MSSTFWALDVGAGEAFLLRTPDSSGINRTLLVDSGLQKGDGAKHPLVEAILKADQNITRIDIAICTHQDADHANGFHTFADAWCNNVRTIGEYWLPGRWSTAVRQLLLNPIDSINRIIDGASELSAMLDHSDTSGSLDVQLRNLIQKIESRATSDIVRERAEQDSVGKVTDNLEYRQMRLARCLDISGDELVSLVLSLEESEAPPSNIYEIFENNFMGHHAIWLFEHETYLLMNILVMRATASAKAIVSIAETALRHTIPIRWFDFSLFEQGNAASGGIPKFIEPISSVELYGPRTDDNALTLTFSLNLSQQNVESLVFYRAETDSSPGVLFTADSRLAFGISSPGPNFDMPTPPQRKIIVTAPHHGSRVNDNAYVVVDKWLGPQTPLLVRNGGHWKQTLKRFCDYKDKRCVECRRCPLNVRQTIEVNAAQSDWDWSAVTGNSCR